MSGTPSGWKKAEQTMIARMGLEEYHASRKVMGRTGGLRSRGGGFADKTIGEDGLTIAQRAGQRGGKVSRKTKVSSQKRAILKDLKTKGVATIASERGISPASVYRLAKENRTLGERIRDWLEKKGL